MFALYLLHFCFCQNATTKSEKCQKPEMPYLQFLVLKTKLASLISLYVLRYDIMALFDKLVCFL